MNCYQDTTHTPFFCAAVLNNLWNIVQVHGNVLVIRYFPRQKWGYEAIPHYPQGYPHRTSASLGGGRSWKTGHRRSKNYRSTPRPPGGGGYSPILICIMLRGEGYVFHESFPRSGFSFAVLIFHFQTSGYVIMEQHIWLFGFDIMISAFVFKV